MMPELPLSNGLREPAAPRLPVILRLSNAVGEVVDALMMPFAPQRVVLRKVARHRLSAYAGAEISRKTRNWKTKRGKPDTIDLPDLQILQDRANEMARNNPYAASAIGSFERNVVGTGIVPSAAVQDKPEINNQLDELWFDWATDPKRVDTERVKDFYDIQEQVLRVWKVAGQAFVLKSYLTDAETGKLNLSLRVLEPESLATQYIRNEDNGNEIRGGVEVDANAAPVAYWFYTSAQIYQLNWKPERIPAERILHIFKQNRPAQTNGVTSLAPSMRKLNDAHDYDRYTLTAAKTESTIAILINTQAPLGGGVPTVNSQSSSDSTTDAGGNAYAELDEGLIFRGQPGDTVTGLKSERPGNGYTPFMQQQIRASAAGMGLSYETVARDFTQGSYSSLRQSLLEDRREYRKLQATLIKQLCRPVWNEFVKLAVLNGQIFAPDYLWNKDRWHYCKWHSQGWEWIDPKAEVDADTKAVDYGIKTREQIIAEHGGDWRETFAQISTEANLAQQLNIVQPERKDQLTLQSAIIEGFIADGTVCDVVANVTDIKALLKNQNVPTVEEYEEPYLPVQDGTGKAVTGGTVTDEAGDVVGGAVADGTTEAPKTDGKSATDEPGLTRMGKRTKR